MLITPTQLPLPVPDSGYLLIEPSNLSDEMWELLPETYPCVPPFLWAAEGVMPRLLKLDQLSESYRNSVSQLLAYEASEHFPPAVCAWLQSKQDTEVLANTIARFLLFQKVDGSQEFWRYFDPRVFVLTAHLFSEDQAHALLGAVECWSFPWRQHWWCIQRARPFDQLLDDLECGWPSDVQWEVLSKARLFYLLHSRLQTYITSSPHCLQELEHSISAFQETYKYPHPASDADRAEFAYLSTRYRKNFRDHHNLIAVWNLLKKGKITLNGMLAKIELHDIEYMETAITKQGISNAKS